MILSRGALCGISLGLLALCSALPARRAEGQAPLREDPEGVIGFAHHLLSSQDHYRAITEYEAFLFLFPQDRRVWEARYFLAKAYQAEGQWDEALDLFRQVAQSGPAESVWAPMAALEVGETLLQANHPGSAARFLEEVARTPGWERIRQKALYRAAWAWLQGRAWSEAVRTLQAIEPGDPLATQAAQLQEEISRGVPALPRRSPWIGGGLAAILPGSGHVYIGRPKEALTSFLLNGAFIAGAVWAIREGYTVTGGILSFFELGWYFGGISTAARGASQFNAHAEARWLQRLEGRWGLPQEEDAPTSLGTLGWSFRF